MASSRRIGAESSETRSALLDAAERLMLREGYAAVTSRRVASEASLKPQLVHYYFRTMDDLFLALFRRGAEASLERQTEALRSPQPLHALWNFSSERTGTALTMEFMALANHRKAIRAEIASYAQQFREKELEALTAVMEERGLDQGEIPPVTLLVLMTSLSRVLVMEEGLGMSAGHAETRALVERFISQLEDEPEAAVEPRESRVGQART